MKLVQGLSGWMIDILVPEFVVEAMAAVLVRRNQDRRVSASVEGQSITSWNCELVMIIISRFELELDYSGFYGFS